MLFGYKKGKSAPVSAEISDYSHKEALSLDNTALVSIDITLPKAGGDIPLPAAKRINEFYQLAAERIIRHAKGQLLREAKEEYALRQEQDDPFFKPYEISTAYTVTLNQAGVLSLYYEVYQYAGGAHGDTVRYGDSWFLSDGLPYPVTLPPRRKAIAIIQRLAAAREAETPGTFLPGYRRALRRYYDPKLSYLTTEGSMVFYPLYTVSPYAAGMQIFLVRRAGV